METKLITILSIAFIVSCGKTDYRQETIKTDYGYANTFIAKCINGVAYWNNDSPPLYMAEYSHKKGDRMETIYGKSVFCDNTVYYFDFPLEYIANGESLDLTRISPIGFDY